MACIEPGVSVQALMFGATLCVGEVVVCTSRADAAARRHLPALPLVWAGLLPAALLITPLLPEPPEEVAAERILGDTGAEHAHFTAGYRHVPVLCSSGCALGQASRVCLSRHVRCCCQSS